MPTDDPQGFDDRLHDERERLADSTAIHEVDRRAIDRWLQRKDGTVATSSLETYARRVRTASERSDVALVEMSEDDFYSLVFDLRHEYELTDATVDNFEAAVLMLVEDMTDAEWPEDAERTTVETETVNPDDVLEPVDVSDLTAAARHQRDIALIEFLADTGARISMALSLRVRDVDLSRPATFTPNPGASGLKGASVTAYPLIDSAADIRSYLRRSHPRPDAPDVALFHKLKPHTRGEDGQRWSDDGGMIPNTTRKQLVRIADEAGVDKPVNPHAFRHAAITRMVREGYSRSQIEHRVHWTLDSDMWEVYEHITGTEHTDDIFREVGLIEGDAQHEKVRKKCGNCSEPLAPHHEWCPVCTQPVSPDATSEVDLTRNTTLEALVEETSPETRRELREILDIIDETPGRVRPHDDPS